MDRSNFQNYKVDKKKSRNRWYKLYLLNIYHRIKLLLKI